MASAFLDSKGWIADFRGLNSPGKSRRRVRVPTDVTRLAPDPHHAAVEYAQRLESLCRVLEFAPNSLTVQDAVSLGAITLAQAESLLDGVSPPPNLPPSMRAPTLEQSALRHPATHRERDRRPAEFDRHLRELREFVQWSGIDLLESLTLDIVQDYLAHLKRQGYSFLGRRHRLLFLRRATRMGATMGFPDPLYGFQLDRDDRRHDHDVLPLDHLCRTAHALNLLPDRRPLAAFALMAFVGLRPSETLRLDVGDLAAGVLSVGKRESKNIQSRRDLPLPKLVAEWVTPLLDREPDCPLLPPRTGHGRMKRVAFDPSTFSQWLGPILEKAAGLHLPIKNLRKSFATWTEESGIEPRYVESFLGHRHMDVAAVTARHYLGKRKVRELMPAAAAIDKKVRSALHRVSTPPRKRKRALQP